MRDARLPAIYQWPESVKDGGLLAYGPRIAQLYRGLARQLVRLLQGAKPADLPIEQPTKFVLVINMKTANIRHSASKFPLRCSPAPTR
jgi:putative tryptophan/tyrosine transport system substrate-binding protein